MDKGRLRRHSSSTTLSKPDPRYAGLSDAAADAAWRQDIAEVFGDGPDGFEAGRDNLTAYRHEMNTIRAAHGDLRWLDDIEIQLQLFTKRCLRYRA